MSEIWNTWCHVKLHWVAPSLQPVAYRTFDLSQADATHRPKVSLEHILHSWHCQHLGVYSET